MRIRDWSSDVCSSDLDGAQHGHVTARVADHLNVDHRVRIVSARLQGLGDVGGQLPRREPGGVHRADQVHLEGAVGIDRKSVVKGKSETERVNLGGRRIIKKTQIKTIKK